MSSIESTPCSAQPPSGQFAEATTDNRLRELERRVAELARGRNQPAGMTIIAFSGDMDKLQAAFMLATGAAAMGMPVTMFFTFWALTALKRKTVFKGKGWAEKLITAMLPAGPQSLSPSKWNLLGLGRVFFQSLMRTRHVATLPELMALSRELDVRIIACETAMELMALTRDELVEGIQFGGVAACLDEAQNSAVTFFV